MDERTLVELSRSGDTGALEPLIALYERKIYNFCFRISGNRDDAYDLAQETFLRMCASITSFRAEAPFSSWIYRIANNVCVDYIRHKSRIRCISIDAPCESEDGEAHWQIADKCAGPEESAEFGDLKHALAAGIRTLALDHRTAIIMHDVQNRTYEEIACAVGCPIGTVKSRLNRARTGLKRYLEGEGLLARSRPLGTFGIPSPSIE